MKDRWAKMIARTTTTASVMASQASTLDPSGHDVSLSTCRGETIHSSGMGGRSSVGVSPYEMPVLMPRYGAMDGAFADARSPAANEPAGSWLSPGREKSTPMTAEKIKIKMDG